MLPSRISRHTHKVLQTIESNFRHFTFNRRLAYSQNQASENFQFTLDNPLLTSEQRQFYEGNGYLICKKLVRPDLLDKWSQYFKDMCNCKVDQGGITLVKDIALMKSGAKGEHLYNKLQDLIWDDTLFQFISLPEVVNIAECFTGPNIVAMHTMLINKPPDAGSATSRHPLHQDMHYFSFRPTNRIVCAWTAMEPVTRENGCLVVVPGSHAGPLYPHAYPKWEKGVNKAYHGVVGFDRQTEDSRVHLTMEKGDTVFFHPHLIHGSGANKTQGFRKAISCHYAASECDYIDVKGTTHEDVGNELVEMSKKKGVTISTFKEFRQHRTRLVRGKEISMTSIRLQKDSSCTNTRKS